jgi:signal transduction histidine kinase
MLVASALLAVLVSTIFALLVIALSDLSESARREAEAKDVVAETISLQKLVLDLEIGVRGFAANRDERYLMPWRQARVALPAALNRFLRGAGNDPRRAREARTLVALIREYRDVYAIPLVEIARERPEAARSGEAVRESRRRIEDVNRRFARFIASDRAAARATAVSADERADRALALGIASVGVSGLLIVLLGVYLSRSIARPVRDVAAAAGRVAHGELTLRLEERGPGEVGDLTRSFNEMARDLAQRRRQLERQNAQLRQSEQLKSELVSIVSHEIRTPLASILGFTSVLLERDLDPESQRRYLEIIDVQGKRLGSLLNDFLDVQRVEEGRFELAPTAVDLTKLIREQIAVFAAGSESHRIEAALPEAPLVVVGDADRLAQVLNNLLSNAIKYSPEGGRVFVTGERDAGAVRIGVTDEGIGIPPSHHDRIFTKFFRGNAAATGIGGSGLGLALARAIVEAHGGQIGFTTKVGEGTTFSIELPTKDEG